MYVVAFKDRFGRLNHLTYRGGFALDPSLARKFMRPESAETKARELNDDPRMRGVAGRFGWSVYS